MNSVLANTELLPHIAQAHPGADKLFCFFLTCLHSEPQLSRIDMLPADQLFDMIPDRNQQSARRAG
jgi:hypothetical protein